nr:hypothetical protein [Thermoanaerobaculia bacterium]
MRKVLMFAVLALLTTHVAWAQANDVGIPAQAGLPMGPGTPFIGGASCPPAGQVDTAFTGATTQDGRIFRDAIASSCPSKTYPGIFNVGTTYNYEAFTYTNTSGATACVTVNFNPDTS